MSNQHHLQTSYEVNIINDIKKNAEPVCYYCKKLIQIHNNKNDLTVDHKTPLSRGGKTVHSNLVIACLKCNQEKANMTEKEYKNFKAAQKRLISSLDAVKFANTVVQLFGKIIDQAQKVNVQYNQVERDLQKLENEIATRSHSTASSLQLVNNLKKTISLRNSLKHRKDTLNVLHSLVSPMKKQIENVKIAESVLQECYSTLKDACIDKSTKNKIVDITDNKTELSS